MRENFLIAFNYFSFVLVTILLTGMQGSLWFQVFGYFPAPYLWIPVLNYWALQRRPVEAVLMTYLITYVLNAMTGMPMGIIFLTLLLTFGLIFVLKDRVLWAGAVHFTFSTAIAALALPLIILALSYAIEDQPVADFQFFNWLLAPLLTALSALPLYPVFRQIDRLTLERLQRSSLENEAL